MTNEATVQVTEIIQRVGKIAALTADDDFYAAGFSSIAPAADSKATDALLKTGLAPVPATVDKTELAAWAHIARVLLNLHETITRS